ncbi:larval cuticle protein 65Ag1-like [Belonocnema kinseyi]|uniref:larval cuticle protein 65Ag1-like n=1 Tax=Belonocnema kinseyi TaxID=2817044 RepID=UPI00143D31C5|nr:larval cuticle protein 65Ag1-like [Belonocnema kinseyi]
MKFLILSFALLAVVAADVSHLRSPYPLVKILRQAHDASPDGSYKYAYETENGIVAEQSGQPGPVGPEGPAVVARGSYKYVGDDGVTYEVKYVADETGFHPEGVHIPLVPEVIERSLKFNAAHPETHYNNGFVHNTVTTRPKPFRH